jgi:putative phosphonate metabolism protein
MFRYALYYMPPPTSPLWHFGCAVLGYDAFTGRTVGHPDQPFFRQDFAPCVAEPRQYGFHATLKPPFMLAPGLAEADLFEAVRRFAATQPSFALDALRLTALGPFLALVPSAPSAALDRLASACVRQFDSWRAPLSEQERARRRPASLSPNQRALLERWGYPYVLEEFRFHLTLSSKLDRARLDQFQRAIEALDPPIKGPLRIDGLALFRQTANDQPFRVLERFALAESLPV